MQSTLCLYFFYKAASLAKLFQRELVQGDIDGKTQAFISFAAGEAPFTDTGTAACLAYLKYTESTACQADRRW